MNNIKKKIIKCNLFKIKMSMKMINFRMKMPKLRNFKQMTISQIIIV